MNMKLCEKLPSKSLPLLHHSNFPEPTLTEILPACICKVLPQPADRNRPGLKITPRKSTHIVPESVEVPQTGPRRVPFVPVPGRPVRIARSAVRSTKYTIPRWRRVRGPRWWQNVEHFALNRRATNRENTPLKYSSFPGGLVASNSNFGWKRGVEFYINKRSPFGCIRTRTSRAPRAHWQRMRSTVFTTLAPRCNLTNLKTPRTVSTK